MSDAVEFLQSARSVLVVDWPTRDVPDTLARAGYAVTVRGGPGPADYFAYEPSGDDIVVRRVGVAPEQADLVYSYRPLEEVPGIIAMAHSLGARAVWVQSSDSPPNEESEKARALAAVLRLAYFDEPYIADAVRSIGEVS